MHIKSNIDAFVYMFATPSVPKYKNVFNTTLVSKTFLYYETEGVELCKIVWPNQWLSGRDGDATMTRYN